MTKAMWTGVLAAACAVSALTAAARADDKKPQPYVVLVGVSKYADKHIPEPSFADKPFSEFRGDLGSEETQERTPGRVVFLANRPNSTSLDGADHGIFAQAVLDALKGAADEEGKEADGLVTVDEL